MESTEGMGSSQAWPVWGIAAVVCLAHLLTNSRYGFHRDELQFLSDALHLEWGYVSYPPLTPFVERVSLAIFGLSIVGLRLLSVFAQSASIVVTGSMARELGGGRLAQGAAALAVALSPLPLFEGTEFQYTTFDYLWWVTTAYFVIRLLKTENPCWWLAIGATPGARVHEQVHHSFPRRSPRRRASADAGAALSCQRLDVGRSRRGGYHLSAITCRRWGAVGGGMG